MKTISIVTANNVTIEYELASTQQRIFAFFIDLLIIAGWILIGSLIAASADSDTDVNIWITIFTIPVFFYTVVSEGFFGGQTIGKRALNVKVVKLNGDNPGLGDFFIRWAFRMVDIWGSAGGAAVLFLSSSEKNQRIGGLLSQTVVINLKPRTSFNIDDLLSIRGAKDHEAAYLGVTQFTDDDMLIIKNALDRYKKYKNKGHKEVVLALSGKVETALQLKKSPKNKIKFLKTVLQDYIVLTRS